MAHFEMPFKKTQKNESWENADSKMLSKQNSLHHPKYIFYTTVLHSSVTGYLFSCDQCDYTNVSKKRVQATQKEEAWKMLCKQNLLLH